MVRDILALKEERRFVVVSAPGHASGEIVRVRLGAYDGERVRAALV